MIIKFVVTNGLVGLRVEIGILLGGIGVVQTEVSLSVDVNTRVVAFVEVDEVGLDCMEAVVLLVVELFE